MALFKKKTYKPVPDEAEIVVEKGKRFARWKNRKRTFKVPVEKTSNGDRIVFTSKKYFARYKDESGRTIEKSTGSKDITNARHVLQGWLARSEKIKAGVLTAEEIKIGERSQMPIDDVLPFYKEFLHAGAGNKHIDETIHRIQEICRDCNFLILSHINSQNLNSWLNEQARIGKRGASTRNHYRLAIVAFLNWAVENEWIARNPITKNNTPLVNTEVDVRRKRRALTIDEINRLLEITQKRPLMEAQTIRTGERKGELGANVREETKKKRELLGLERMAMYSVMIYTGLRKSELESLRVGQLFLDEKPPFLFLEANDAKNKKEAEQPLHSHLVSILKKWIDAKAAAKGVLKLAPDEPLFYVPEALYKILNRDLHLAGIEKKNFRDQSIDVHALRHTHATQMARAEVSPTITQKSMRHSNIRLTLGVYTHLERGDIAEGIEKLPKFGETDS